MQETRNYILAVIGIFSALSIPLVIDSCNEDEEVAHNTLALVETESYTDDFTFEVDSIRPEHRADTYVEETSNELEIATSFMSDEGQEIVLEQEAIDEVEVEHTEPLVVDVEYFDEAFRVARIHLGPGKEWIWNANGITYTTFYAEEKVAYDSVQSTYWTEGELSSGTNIVEVELIPDSDEYATQD